MGKGKYINPILTNTKNQKEGGSVPKPRKVNSNKLHDIKIPVSENLDLAIRREAYKKWDGSKTAISTEVFLYGLYNLFYYPEVIYKDGPTTVHVKIDHDTYMKVGEYASTWKCSIRKAAHRIFIESAKKQQLAGVKENEV